MSNYKHVAYITLFENEPNGNKPVLSGTLEMPDGRKMKVSLWKKQSKTGGKDYFSGSVQQEEGQTATAQAGPQMQAAPTPSFSQYPTSVSTAATAPVTSTVPNGYNVNIKTTSASEGGAGDLPF
jgi:hypothetical protein